MARSSAEPRPRPATLGELRDAGWRSRTVKEEMRANLVGRLAAGKPIFPGIVGYEDTVHPGDRERGPRRPGHRVPRRARPGARRGWRGCWSTCWTSGCRSSAAASSTTTRSRPSRRRPARSSRSRATRRPIDWLPRDRRYGEKLATPDITIADLIGEVDPIRVAEGRYLSDELTLHFGLIPRCNRGIFAINELPDLAERIQVGLLNILEERDVQVRGFTIRLPLDLFVVASRQPGGLHQPRPDHHAAQGPPRVADPDALPADPRARGRDHPPGAAALPGGRRDRRRSSCPAFMEELLAELTHLARRSPEISQRSGVSVRVSVANMEVLEAAAIKRAVRLGEPSAAPRVSATSARSSRRRPARSSWSPSATTRPRSGSSSGSMTKALFATFNRRRRLDELEDLVRGVRGRASSSRPATASRRATMSAGCARSRACATPSSGWARSTRPTARRSPRSWRRPWSSCSRACTSSGGSTRTAARRR